jgi:nucleotide-binding universal stress UspA family protein
MFKNVIVGVSGPVAALDAVALARLLLAPEGRITLAHVKVVYPIYVRGALRDLELESYATARRLLNDLAAETGVSATAVVDARSVAYGLHDLAARKAADLIVVGTSRRKGMSRVLIGDDARRSLSGAHCAVAISPAGSADATPYPRRIGVAYNGSNESRQALAFARVLAAENDAQISLLQAVGPPACFWSQTIVPYAEMTADMVVAAQQELDQIDGVKTRARSGDPFDLLTEFTSTVDLLVVGSRSLGPMGRLRHSSLSRRLTRTARCPLLILARPVRDPDAATGPDAVKLAQALLADVRGFVARSMVGHAR